MIFPVFLRKIWVQKNGKEIHFDQIHREEKGTRSKSARVLKSLAILPAWFLGRPQGEHSFRNQPKATPNSCFLIPMSFAIEQPFCFKRKEREKIIKWSTKNIFKAEKLMEHKRQTKNNLKFCYINVSTEWKKQIRSNNYKM